MVEGCRGQCCRRRRGRRRRPFWVRSKRVRGKVGVAGGYRTGPRERGRLVVGKERAGTGYQSTAVPHQAQTTLLLCGRVNVQCGELP